VVSAFIRTREQVVPVGLAVAFILASLGGLLWPLYNMPESMQQLARLLITTWSMVGIQDVMLRDRGLSGISTELLVLAIYGVSSFVIASWLFRYDGRSREI
jgi:ABC-2 type transport system permease protein